MNGRIPSGLRASDLRAAYLLIGACTELGQHPDAWHRRLAEGLRERLGCPVIAVFEGGRLLVTGVGAAQPSDQFYFNADDGPQVFKAFREFWARSEPSADPTLCAWSGVRGERATRTRSQLVSPRAWLASPIYQELFQPLHLNHTILSRCPMGEGRHLLINGWRDAGDRPFSQRELSFVELVMRELHGLLRSNRLLPLGGLDVRLSPRMRQTLVLLCRGLSEKQAAAELAISHHTIHNHIKRLHRTFGVSSRGELLAAAQRVVQDDDPQSGCFNLVL